MRHYALDIETRPTTAHVEACQLELLNAVEQSYRDLAAGVYSMPSDAKKSAADKAEARRVKALQKTQAAITKRLYGGATSPLTGYVVGWCLRDLTDYKLGVKPPVRTVFGLEDDEAGIVNELDILLRIYAMDDSIAVWTWNGQAFDVPFLRWRMALHGVRYGDWLDPIAKPWEAVTRDALRVMQGNRMTGYSLDAVARFFGIADRPDEGEDYWRRIFDSNPEEVLDEVQSKCIEDTRILGCILDRVGLIPHRSPTTSASNREAE